MDRFLSQDITYEQEVKSCIFGSFSIIGWSGLRYVVEIWLLINLLAYKFVLKIIRFDYIEVQFRILLQKCFAEYYK